MRNMKRWLAVLMSATVALSSAGVSQIGTVAAFAEATYNYTLSNVKIPDQEFTGEVPDLSKVDELATVTTTDNLTLTRGVDYKVEADGSAKGERKAIFTGMGNYEGKTIAPVTFNIVETTAAAKYDVTVDTAKIVYDGDALDNAEVAPLVTVIKDEQKKLTADEYTVTVTADAANKTNDGTAGEKYRIVVKVNGVDKAVYDQTVAIAKKDLSELVELKGTPATPTPVTYDGKAKTFDSFEKVEYKFAKEDSESKELAAADYSITGFENNTNAGDKAVAEIKAASASKNFTGTAKVSFTINQAVIGSDTKLVVDSAPTQEYNGSVWNPTLNVKAYFKDSVTAQQVLAADYEIEYVNKDSKDVGEYAVTIKPSKTGNLKVDGKVPAVKAYAITAANVKDVTVTQKEASIPAGTDVTADFEKYFEVKKGDYKLVAGEDYQVAYNTGDFKKANTKCGITLTGQGKNFTGTKTVEYTTAKKELAAAYTSTYSIGYTGSEQRPENSKLGTLTEKDAKGTPATLTASDYNVTKWENNTNASNEAKVTIEGKGDYEGQTATATFTIAPKSIEGEGVEATVTGISKGSFYQGMEITGATVEVNKVKLTADDCKVTAETIKEGYLTQVKVEGKGNYTGSKSVAVNVAADKVNLANATVEDKIPAGLKNYSAETLGKYVKVSVDGKEVDASNYTLDVTAPSEVKVGSTVAYKITANTQLTGTKSGNLTVVARNIADLKDAVSLKETEFTYTGAENKPAAAVKETADTNALTNADYEVTYANNVDAGTATATITGKGNYTGSVTKEFKINKAALTAEDIVLVEPAAADRQFKVGVPADLSAKLELKAKDGSKYKFSASDYTIKQNANQKVEATDKATDKEITYTVTINKDSKNYVENSTGFEVSYKLVPKTVSDAEVTLEKNEVVYAAGEIAAYKDKLGKITVKVDGTELKEGTDYDVVLSGVNKIASEIQSGEKAPYVEITFKGNYVGVNNATKFTITPAAVDMSKVKLFAPSKADLQFTGNAIVPTNNDTVSGLTAGTDYTIVYTDAEGKKVEGEPTAVGTYTATPVATAENGGTSGTAITYTITAKALTASEFDTLTKDLALNPVDYASEATKAPEITGTNAKQFEVVEFDKTWDGKAKTGSATLALKADANYKYEGTVKKPFTWNKADIKQYLDNYVIEPQEYTGSALTPAVTVKEGSDLSADWVTVVNYENNENVSTKTAKANVKITVPADAKYAAGTTETTIVFDIVAASIEKVTVSDVDDVEYTGAAITPEVTVKDANGAELKKDTDYTVSYANNTEAGAATITIKGIKNYTGEVTKTFNILAPTEDEQAADAVTDKISSLNENSTAKEVEEARAAYNALTDEQKAMVDSDALDKLAISEARVKAIAAAQSTKATAIVVPAKTVVYNGKVVASSKAVVSGSKGKVTYKYYNAKKKAIKASAVKNAGTYYVRATVAAKDGYPQATSALTKIVIKKKAPTLKKVTPVKKALKAKALRKKAQTFALKATKTGGKVTFVKKSGNKKILVNKAGKVTVKKGLKKGTYKVVVTVKLAKSANYTAKNFAKTIKVVVK